ADWDNIRAAVIQALDGEDLASAARLVVATARFATFEVHHEHRDWGQRTRDLAERIGQIPPPAVFGFQAWWLGTLGQQAEAGRLATGGIDAATSPTESSTASCWYARCLFDANMDDIDPLIDRHGAAAAAGDIIDRNNNAWLQVLAGERLARSDPAAGIRRAARGVELMEELANGSSHAAAWAWLELARGQLAAMAQEYTGALEHFNAALEHARRAHHPIMFASTSVYLAGTLRLRGGPIDAAEYLRALDLVERHGAFEAQIIGYVASHLLSAGGLEPATTLIAYLEASGVQSIEAGWSWPEKPDHPQAERWWSRGAALSLEQAIEYAREALRALTT
ncbi:MAG: hypothetical protein WBM50_05305, partial [Acidimicrobiales bacterium]